MTDNQLLESIAREMHLGIQQIKKTVALFDEGATIPFIARYRTGCKVAVVNETGAFQEGITMISFFSSSVECTGFSHLN